MWALLRAAGVASPSDAADRLPPSFAAGAAVLAPREAVAVGVLRADGGAAYADGAFQAWFPVTAGQPDLTRLTQEARRGRPAIGRVETADGAVLAAWAGPGDATAAWPLEPGARAALAGPGRVLVVVFAPSRSSELAQRAADAFALSPLETRLAEALLFAPTLELAAARIGVGRETARDAQRRIAAKLGVRRAPEIVRRLLDLMCGGGQDQEPDVEILAEAYGFTPAEARAALAVAAGRSNAEAGQDLGLKAETVRGYVRSALAKTGLGRAKDLGRLLAETQALSRLVGVAEPVFTDGAPPARLRVLPAQDGRRMAFLDYGPMSGRPVCVFHGFIAGRSLPPGLVRALHRRGYRPVALQRPGFGLTDPARGDYLAQASADLLALTEALGGEPVAVVARDGGTAAALDFARRHPDRLSGAVVLNPRPPEGVRERAHIPVLKLTGSLLRHPHLIGGIGELLRRQTRTDLVEAQLRRALQPWAADREALEDPAIRDQLVRDIQAQFAHTSAGFAAEHALYARDWSVPELSGQAPWTLLFSEGLGDAPRAPWAGLPGAEFRVIDGAGVLAQFTHPEALAAPLDR